jgi:HK97 family phage major capsid protein
LSGRAIRRSASGGLKRTYFEQRTLATNAGAGSGTELAADGSVASWLYTGMIEVSGVLRAQPEILRTGTGNPLDIPTIIDDGELTSGTDRVDEQGTINKAEPSFGQVSTSAFAYKQALTISRELVEDANVDLNRLIGRHLGKLLGRYFGRDLVLGSNTNQPFGVHTAIPSLNKVQAVAGAAGIPSSTSGKNDFDLLYEIIAKIPADLREGGTWLLHPDSVLTLRKAKATSGLVIWPARDELLAGYPYVTDSRITPIGTGAADGTCMVIFFNPAAYLVRLIKQVRVEWSILTAEAFETDQVSVRAVLRADGRPLDVNALAGLSRNTT